MADIRPFQPDDLQALYRIALATGDAGGDAARLYREPKLVGHLYAAPYAILNPETTFVAEDEDGVAGYILGAADTRAFEALAEERWWPTLRALYDDPAGTPHGQWSPDQRLSYLIHHPWRAPHRIVEPFPSHLHIDLLPRLQGRGLGLRLMDLWLGTVRALGSRGAHLGVNSANARAMRFYRAYGLTEPVLAKPPPAGVVWFAVKFEGD
jgi:ribosomal protein S18 acetylase RimI-like enzyme